MSQSLLSIENLKIGIHGTHGYTELIKGLDLKVDAFKIVALVGISGSGKTTIGLSILRLLPDAMAVTDGKIIFLGENILELPQKRMRQLRGKELSMVFQEPLSAFDPVFTVGFQIEEVLKSHTTLKRSERKKRIEELFDLTGIPDFKRIANQYPHQLSGGMRQRAMIAQAIAANPKLIIADEPTSNLDVTRQAVIIELFRKLKNDLKMSILLITHDLGVVRELADDVGILYNGRIVESGKTRDILDNPSHPFTCELVNTIKV